MSDPINVEQNLEFKPVAYLPARNRSYLMAFWQNRRPITAAEINHIQQIQRDALDKLGSSIAQMGFSFRSDFSTNWNLNPSPQTLTMTLGRSQALLAASIVEVGAAFGDGSFSFDIGGPPTTGVREDFIFLEVYSVSVGGIGTDASDKNVYVYGNEANGSFPNDILQPAPINTETMRRVQTRWIIRYVPDVNFQSNSNGFDSTVVTAQGGNVGPIANKTFVDVGVTSSLNEPARREYSGLYRAGAGNADDILNTVDGYSWALPMFRITRTAGNPQPTIIDLRQLTNGNYVGIFEFIAPCTLKVKALPVEFFDCAGVNEQVRIMAGNSPLDPTQANQRMNGIVGARQFQSTAISTNDNPVPPFISNSTALVHNFNTEFLQGTIPGNGAGNVLLLDSQSNAAIQGYQLSLASGGIGGSKDFVRLTNFNTNTWLINNANYDNTNSIWSLISNSSPASAISLERVSGKISFMHGDANINPVNWSSTAIIDKAGNLATFNTNLVVPTGNVGIGLSSPSVALDIVGNERISATGTGAGLVITSLAGAGISLTANGAGINATSTTNDAVLGTASIGTAGHFVNGATGAASYAVKAEGNSYFLAPSGGLNAQVGINTAPNTATPTVALDVVGTIKTTGFQFLPVSVPSAGQVLSAIDNTGRAAWVNQNPGNITGSSGTVGRLTKWGTTTGIVDSSISEDVTTANLGIGVSPTLQGVTVGKSLEVGGSILTSVPDTGATLTNLATGALVLGGALATVSMGTEAIFSNRVGGNNLGGISFMAASIVRMTIDKTGLVGIGMNGSTPTTVAQKLEVAGNITAGTSVTGKGRVDYPYITVATDSGSNKRAGIEFMHVGADIHMFGLGVDSIPDNTQDFFVRDIPNATVRFRIDQLGHTGINTGTNPLTQALHVGGNAQTDAGRFISTSKQTDTGVYPGLDTIRLLNGDGTGDKHSHIRFHTQIGSASPVSQMEMGVDILTVGTADFYIKNNVSAITNFYSDSTGKTTIGANQTGTLQGTGRLNVGSGTGVLLGASVSSFAAGGSFTGNSGILGNTAGNSLQLAAFGYQASANHSSLGMMAYRTGVSASDWTTTVIGIGAQNDTNTILGGNNASLWFSGNDGIVAVGAPGSIPTFTNGYKLDVWGSIRSNSNVDAVANVTAIAAMGIGSGLSLVNQPLSTGGVNGIQNDYPNLTFSSGLANRESYIRFKQGNQSLYSIIQTIAGDNTNTFTVYDSIRGVYRFHVDDSGNTGFNINAPRAPFDVNLTARINRLGINGLVDDGVSGIPWSMRSIGPVRMDNSGGYPSMQTLFNDATAGVHVIGYPGSLTDNEANGQSGLYVEMQNSSLGGYAAQIINRIGRGININVPVNNYAIAMTGIVSHIGNYLLAGNFTGTGNLNISNISTLYQVVVGAGSLTANGATILNGTLVGNGVTQFNQTVTLNNIGGSGDNQLTVGGNISATGLTNTARLYCPNEVVFYNSMQIRYTGAVGSGRLHNLLNQFIGQEVKKSFLLGPTNSQITFRPYYGHIGFTMYQGWVESEADVISPSLAGNPSGVYTLISTASGATFTLSWQPVATAVDISVHRSLGNFWWDADAQIIRIQFADYSPLEYVDSTNIKLRVKQIPIATRPVFNSGVTVDTYNDDYFAPFTFYLAKPSFIRITYNTNTGVGQGAGTSAYITRTLNLTSNGSTPYAVTPHATILQQTGVYAVGASVSQVVQLAAGMHTLREYLHASDQFGNPTFWQTSFQGGTCTVEFFGTNISNIGDDTGNGTNISNGAWG